MANEYIVEKIEDVYMSLIEKITAIHNTIPNSKEIKKYLPLSFFFIPIPKIIPKEQLRSKADIGNIARNIALKFISSLPTKKAAKDE